MSSNDDDIKRMVSGSSVGLIGSVLGAMLQLLFGVVVVRLVSVSEYGLFSLAVVIVTTLSIISMLGFGNSAPQLISKYQAKQEPENALGIIKSSIAMVFIISVVISFVVIYFSEDISLFFGKQGLEDIIKIMALLIVSNSLILTFVSVFRGVSKALPGALFNEVLNRLLRLIGLVVVYFYSLELIGVVWSTVVASVLICFIFGVFTFSSVSKMFKGVIACNKSGELILFSMPIYGNAVIELLLISTSTLLLGYLSNQEEVGYYGVAISIARMLQLPLSALAFMYLPIATKVKVRESKKEVEELFVSSTKWIVFITLPVFMIIVAAAEFVITALFGVEYKSSAMMMIILSIGFFVHVMMGPNAMTLLSYGYRKAIFISSIIAAVVNVALCFYLIPKLGGIGAAISLASAFVLSNLFISFNLFMKCGIHIVKMNYLKMLVFNLTLLLLVIWGLSHVSVISNGLYFVLMIILIVFVIISPLLTKSLDANDMNIIELIESRFSNNNHISTFVHKWVNR